MIFKKIISHSRIRRALEERRLTSTGTLVTVGSVIVIAVITSAFGLLVQGLSGTSLFIVALLGALAGPSVVWLLVFLYRIFRPMQRFSVGVGNISPMGGTEDHHEEFFAIKTVTNQCPKDVGQLEVKAALPDGTVCGWVKTSHKTFCGEDTIFLSKYPSTWPTPEGDYRLTWRGTSWGLPAQIIAMGTFSYTAGSWRDIQ